MEQTRYARATGIILSATAVILPPLGVFAPLGTAALLTVVAIAFLALDWRRCRDAFTHSLTLSLLLAGLGIWGTVSSLWSILPAHSLIEGLRFLALSAAGLIILGAARTMDGRERENINMALIAGVVLAIALLAIERFAHQPITRFALHIASDQYVTLTRFDRGVTILILALWPALFAAGAWWRRLLLAGAILAVTIVLSSQTSLLAALLSIAVYGIARWAPRAVAAAMILGAVALSCAIPLAAPSNETVVALWHDAPWIKPSGIHRLLIWRFGANRVAERPLLGWGMDASREMPGGKTDLNAMLPDLHYGDRIEAMPLHPHDAALQWQLELGLPGSILGLSIIAWTLWWVAWRAPLTPDRRAGALALASAALTVGMLSFGVWQSWWLSTLWLIIALCAASGKAKERST